MMFQTLAFRGAFFRVVQQRGNGNGHLTRDAR
jgi:hypothetical protein